MSDESSESRNLKRSNDVADRFDAYFLALTFTLVAAAVQTAKWSDVYPWSNRVEVGAWLFLTASGLVGLYRAEQQPGFFFKAAHASRVERAAAEMAANPAEKHNAPAMGKVALDLQVELDEWNERFKGIYKWQRLLFVVGLLLSVGRRGFEGLIH